MLDRLVGFELSPVLWRKIQPKLSAGRVQSVALRLVVDREREILAFNPEQYYKVDALFHPEGTPEHVLVKATLDRRFPDMESAKAFLEKCIGAEFTISDIEKKETTRTPAAPFTTSTLQQEASRKLRMSVSQTMSIAQKLYEHGLITYMRTDSTNLSSLAINTAKQFICNNFGEEYSKVRQYKTKAKGAQEAHEAIRPTYIENTSIEGTPQEQKLYELIWKRTVASQMADALIEKTQVNISVSGATEQFVVQGEVVKFDGFMKVYAESRDDDNEQENMANQLPQLTVGQTLERREIVSTERFSQSPIRYTEASLVHKLEELGIGRPSTYAPTISTIQQREYVQKGDKKGVERTYVIDTLRSDVISSRTKKEMAGSDKGKLLPTDIGIVVNDFLNQYFPTIMDYHFTAKVEAQFDEIADGKEPWINMIKEFYKDFKPVVEETINIRSERKAGEREVGIDPKSGKPVFVKIGRFGPVVQIGLAEDNEKPRFAQLPAEKSMETITLEEALSLFSLPRNLGDFEGHVISVGAGRFGPYIQHNKKYVSIPAGTDPMLITLEEAVNLIVEKREQEEQRHIKSFENDSKMQLLNGRYGPYIAYDGKNYRLPKAMHERVRELTYEECIEIVNNPVGSKRSSKK